ncbi:alanine--glyoxylate aminotransferase isoform X1 [Nematostella vectensis]|nr:alanine--glyoxylate aminotransferase isoform X1 [Nematostella vectensis]XP_048578159.1 alanine--glyoxylate aminotransferase isoform X1 [Nematostella vectensis]
MSLSVLRSRQTSLLFRQCRLLIKNVRCSSEMAHFPMQTTTKIEPPKALLKPLAPHPKLLFGPGPSNPNARIYNAAAMPMLGHFQKEFHNILDEIKAGLQYAFQTNNEYTLVFTGAGHTGMEGSMMNIVERGETFLVCENGMWGMRAKDIADRQGLDVRVIKKTPGEAFTLEDIEAALKEHKPAAMFITHSESSTGVCQPLEGVGALCHKYNCLVIADTVASLGGTPFFTDDLELDVVYTGSQKVFGCPPGICPITFSPRAIEKVRNRKTRVPSFYLDILEIGNYWGCDEGARRYHHTAPINLLYTLRESLAQLAEESLESCWKRHHDNAELFWKGIEDLGLKMFVKDKNLRLPTLNTIEIPPDFPNWKGVLDYLMSTYHFEIVGGMGPTVGKVWRIGMMGFNSHKENVPAVLRLFKEALDATKQSAGK